MKITFEDLKVNSLFYRISDFKDLKPYKKISLIIALNNEEKKIKINKFEIVCTDKEEIIKTIENINRGQDKIKPLSFFYIINPFRIKDAFWNKANFLHRLPSRKELNKIYA